MSQHPLPVPPHLAGLVDDAAIFPPGDLDLAAAVPAHRAHRRAPYAPLVGAFVVSDARLPDLLRVVEPDTDEEPLPVAVVVGGGAGALEGAVRWATRSERLRLAGVEIALRGSDTGELAHNARRIVTAVDALVAAGELDEDVPVHVEPPRFHTGEAPYSWLAALDEVAAADLRVKLRTGGLDADAFPGADELAASIGAVLDRELRFKCTAGLHHALRHTAGDGGFEHHGFLNVILATRASLDGDDVAEVARGLDERDPAAVLERWHAAGPAGLASARRWFTSFGSCSVTEPVEDLAGLGLLGPG
ncbi:MAG: hypothetical protein ACXVWU_03750 [Nocardioides sp.]